MKSLILSILLTLSQHNIKEEKRADYEERMQVIGTAIHASSEVRGRTDKKLAALLLTIGHHESHFRARIHRGDCQRSECDGGRSATPWQVMWGSWLPKDEWLTFIGVEQEPTSRAAAYAGNVLRRGLRACKSVKGALSLYATGKTCYWRGKGPNGIEARFKTYQSVYRRLSRSPSTSGKRSKTRGGP